jgi:eukaryotic-like serine/threonine-protein kinase
MQFVSGKTLQERLVATGSFSVPEILRIGMQTASGLAAAHAQGLVHRDIKPANILLENGVERVKITDFGLARAVDDVGMTQTGVVAGTPQFMAPEQANGESIDVRSDLFSLGSVLYTLCTGRPPFRATTTMGLLKRICEETPRPIRELNPEIPAWLEAIISRLLKKTANERYQSAKEVADLLSMWLAHVQRPTAVPAPDEKRTDGTNGTKMSLESWRLLILLNGIDRHDMVMTHGCCRTCFPHKSLACHRTGGQMSRHHFYRDDPPQ